MSRPVGSNADEWHLFLCGHLDSRAASPDGPAFMAVQISEAIDEAFEDGRRDGEAALIGLPMMPQQSLFYEWLNMHDGSDLAALYWSLCDGRR